MSSEHVQVRTASDRALLVQAVDLDHAIRLQRGLTAAALRGVSELVPGAETVLVRFDPSRTTAAELSQRITTLDLDEGTATASTTIEVPVRYDGEDLDELAGSLQVSAEEIVRRHTEAEWQVAFTGFAPGFGYLVCDDPFFSIPRRPSPRTKVPAGSVGLAGHFSGVYPRESPGGWQLIGRTDAVLWDLDREPPALFTPGARVRFSAVDREVVAVRSAGVTDPPPAEHRIEVVRTGLQLLVQDLGRHGHAALGVSASGAADRGALREANRLVGNEPAAAGLECLGGGAVLRFTGRGVAALTGARAELSLTDTEGRVRPVHHRSPFAVEDGDELAIGPVREGLRCVVALRGGLHTGTALHSRSTDTLAGLGPQPLSPGAVVGVGDPRTAPHSVLPDPVPPTRLPRPGDEVELRITLGPRDDWFTEAALQTLTDQPWEVTPRSDRVGIRLAGDTGLERAREGELPSEGAVTGAIQVPPDGQPVLFLPDHPLTGGYPVVGAVIDADLDLAAQLPPGSTVRFVIVDPSHPSPTPEPVEGQTTSPEPSPSHRGESMSMSSVLIANRGEIAVRIIRACAEAGLTSIAVYADQDVDAMHVRLADRAVALEGTTAAETYLDIESLIRAARTAGADAVHPGYGFLSENAGFARAVEEAGLIWIGPTGDTIEALGDKVTARRIAEQVGAPLVPGLDRPLEDAAEAVAFAEEHGLPVVIKAAHGGGGRGMKVVADLDSVADAYEAASREAKAAFGRGECFVERFLERPRHVEVQVLGDGRGGVVTVGDRDCSLQRRNQKLVEEAPAPGLTEQQRETLHAAARDICAAVDYRGAATVEFLLAGDGTLSFLEVNTRLQVEHPVTEMVTGVDLVREQFRIAQGVGPSFEQTPALHGHAIEFRINAEDPRRGFLPSPGQIDTLRVPGGPGVRWDAGVEAGDVVQPAFDSMMAKLIVGGDDRDAALVRARRALDELVVEGPATVVPFSREALDHPAFSTDGFSVSTQWIESELLAGTDSFTDLSEQDRPDPVEEVGLERTTIEIDGRLVRIGLPTALLAGMSGAVGGAAGEDAPSTDPGAVLPPAPGSLVKWLVADGDTVEDGQELAVLDAMKMETRVAAPRGGVVQQLVEVGAVVTVDAPIATIKDVTHE
ncbi:MAG TPA: carboxyltransferase domain-containing protein [Candidatus Avipropionibacterium avicola]|uniref:biotin carboxylase n=1 Tax=Candidatus Avipropionibacterium avicola TaxID=2840701 RepID=A0A9D1GWB3_9ACTN|nr:carboxyltransferase domain-containing protein [Candidatus Avipropionibacterium avicola]